jgi:hypothetical protein
LVPVRALADETAEASMQAPAMADAWEMGVRRRRKLMIRAAVAAAVVVVLVGVLVAVRSWMTWQAAIDVSSWRTTVDGEAVPAPEDGSAVVIEARDDRIVTLELGFSSPDAVEITDVAVTIPPRAPVRFFALQSATGPVPEQGEQPWDDFEPFDPTSDAAQRLGMQMRVILSTTTAACDDFAPGASVVIDELEVTYEARQRTRRTTVPLPTPIDVEVPADGCG